MHHGDRAAEQRTRPRGHRRRGARSDGPRARGNRRPRHRARSRGSAPVPAAHGGGEPAPRRVPQDGARGDDEEPRILLRDLPGARRAPQAARGKHERGRAADADPRPRAHDRAEDPPRRRALRGPRAYTSHPHHRQDQGAEGELRAHGSHGRAEFQPGDPHRRPRLRDRARAHRVRGRLARGPREQRADPQAVHGVVMERLTVRTLVLVVASAVGGIVLFIVAVWGYLVYKINAGGDLPSISVSSGERRSGEVVSTPPPIKERFLGTSGSYTGGFPHDRDKVLATGPGTITG